MPAKNLVTAQQKRDNKGRFIVEGSDPAAVSASQVVAQRTRKGGVTAEQQTRYLTRLHKRVTMEDWDAIAEKAIKQAKEGNWRARQWLSDYCMGKAQPPSAPAVINDNRSLELDFSKLSGEQLAKALELARLLGLRGETPGGTGDSEAG